MASYAFRNIRGPVTTMSSPSLQMRLSSGPTFGQKLGYGLSQAAPYSSLIGSISSGMDFFSELFKPSYSGTGLTSQEKRQAKKQSGYSKALKGVNFALQTLASIASFI